MAEFRYRQFCPLARAAEIVGERWTLLIVRELLLGPQRFSDLRRRLGGVSSSVLAERVGRLEERGLVARRELPPPTPAAVYELSERGRGLEPVLLCLARWGAQFLGPLQPGDRVEPEWVRLGLIVFARKAPTPARSFAVRVSGEGGEASFRVSGGSQGTRVTDAGGAADASIRGAPLAVFGLACGRLDPGEAVRAGALEIEGDSDVLADFSALFDTSQT